MPQKVVGFQPLPHTLSPEGVATYVEMDLDHHMGKCALLPSLLSYSIVVSTLDWQSGDLGWIFCAQSKTQIKKLQLVFIKKG